jgi:hypothetical protein
MFSGSVTLGARAKIAFTNLLLQVSGAGDQVLTGTITWLTIADTATTKLAAIVEVFVADQIARLTLTHPNGTQLAVPAWKGINPATPYATKYSARFSGGSSGEPSPNGYGFDTFTIANRGALTLAGRLPDGMAYTSASFVGHRGEVLANQLLYTYKGSLTGQLAIAPATPVTSNTLTGSRTWNKPAISTETVFKLGFAPPSRSVRKAAPTSPLPAAHSSWASPHRMPCSALLRVVSPRSSHKRSPLPPPASPTKLPLAPR